MSNKILREQFLKWHKAAYEPSLTKLAKEIGISRPGLSEWKNGHRDFGDVRLERVRVFLEGKVQ